MYQPNLKYVNPKTIRAKNRTWRQQWRHTGDVTATMEALPAQNLPWRPWLIQCLPCFWELQDLRSEVPQIWGYLRNQLNIIWISFETKLNIFINIFFPPIITDFLWFISTILILNPLGRAHSDQFLQTWSWLQQRIKKSQRLVRNHGFVRPWGATSIPTVCHWLSPFTSWRVQIPVAAFNNC